MSDAEKMQLAQELYGTLCSFMEKKGFHYDKFDKDLMVMTAGKGEDLTIILSININTTLNLINVNSIMPFEVKDDYLVQTAIAIAYANYGCVLGHFDLTRDKKIIFSLNTAYNDCIIGEDLFEYLFGATISIVDKFNDRFAIVANKKLSLEQINALICEE